MKLKNDMLCAVAAVLCFLLFSCESTPAVTDDDVTLDATPEVTIPVAEVVSESPETDNESDMINGDDESNLTDEILVDTTFAEPELVITENSNDKIETNSDEETLVVSASNEADIVESESLKSETSSANTDIESSVSDTAKKDDDNKQSDAEPAPVGSILEYEPEVGALSREPVPDTKEPSRTVTAFVGTLLEVRYPGKGWVFLGDSAQSRTIVYRTKKIDSGDTVFVFMPQTAGTALLSFFRYDALKDTYEDDVVNVVISAADSADARTMAPAYTPESPVPAPVKPNVTQTIPEATMSESARSDVADVVDDEPSLVFDDSVQDEPTNKTPTAIVPDPALDALSSAELITAMENALKAGEPTRVIEAALVYARGFSDNLDYVRYMTGNAYELAGDTRDMKKAIECYESVVSAFPYSKYWQPSSDRIKYIRRFFFTIR